MAFWLERILSSKRLVCNRTQTGPVSSLPSSWQLSKCLRSKPHNCVQFQECQSSVKAPPGLHRAWLHAAHQVWICAVKRCWSELKSPGQVKEGHYLLPLLMRSYPLPPSPSETLIANALNSATEQFSWHGILIKLEGRASGFRWGNAGSCEFFPFHFYCFCCREIPASPAFLLLFQYPDYTLPILSRCRMERLSIFPDIEEMGSIQEPFAFQTVLWIHPLFRELWGA